MKQTKQMEMLSNIISNAREISKTACEAYDTLNEKRHKDIVKCLTKFVNEFNNVSKTHNLKLYKVANLYFLSLGRYKKSKDIVSKIEITELNTILQIEEGTNQKVKEFVYNTLLKFIK